MSKKALVQGQGAKKTSVSCNHPFLLARGMQNVYFGNKRVIC